MPIPFRIQEDELFTSWFGAVMSEVCRRTGLDENQFERAFLGLKKDRHFPSRFLCPTGLDNLWLNFQDTALFPDVFDIIEKHTVLGVMSPGMTRAAKAQILESVMRSSYRRRNYFLQKTDFRMCPECREQDAAVHGREVVHTLHQVPGLRICPEHGCALEGCDVKDFGIEHRVAAYAKALYDKPFEGGMEETDRVLDIYQEKHSFEGALSFIYDGIYAGYLDDASLSYPSYRHRHTGMYQDIIRMLPYITESPEEFRRMAGCTEHKCADTEDMTLLEERNGLGRYRCRHCGRVFHMHEYTAASGKGCPYCEGHGISS